MTEILKVSESLKGLIYGPTCSVQSAEDRAIVIEDQLGELFTIGETLEEIEDERDNLKNDLDERDGELQECRELLGQLIEAIDGLQVTGYADSRIGTLIVSDPANALTESTRRALADVMRLARLEADKT
jgi:hypothetical protein